MVSVSLGAAPKPLFAAALVLRMATSDAMLVAGRADDMSDVRREPSGTTDQVVQSLPAACQVGRAYRFSHFRSAARIGWSWASR